MTEEEAKRDLIGPWTLTERMGKRFYRFDDKQIHRLFGTTPSTVSYKLVSNGTTIHIVSDDETVELLGFSGDDMFWKKGATRYVLNRGTIY